MQKDDVIYRQDAIDAMADAIWHYPNEKYAELNDYENARRLADYGLNRLPSVQPEQKIGYWIPVHPLQADDEGAYLCSNCNTGDWDIKPTDKFCKFCGAKMQGVKKV